MKYFSLCLLTFFIFSLPSIGLCKSTPIEVKAVMKQYKTLTKKLRKYKNNSWIKFYTLYQSEHTKVTTLIDMGVKKNNPEIDSGLFFTAAYIGHTPFFKAINMKGSIAMYQEWFWDSIQTLLNGKRKSDIDSAFKRLELSIYSHEQVERKKHLSDEAQLALKLYMSIKYARIHSLNK